MLTHGLLLVIACVVAVGDGSFTGRSDSNANEHAYVDAKRWPYGLANDGRSDGNTERGSHRAAQWRPH